ncbi:hypothetical protein SAMN04488115_109134 [Bosea lathyri]|uniref:Uncharacterized protein n=1 Tax=Bosea lathyri TaxID=1036778 RepID=A0A1H6C8Q1_9HYPH|nr:hypothetical protein SAMN04488115_109134 [Bosea lathyri]
MAGGTVGLSPWKPFGFFHFNMDDCNRTMHCGVRTLGVAGSFHLEEAAAINFAPNYTLPFLPRHRSNMDICYWGNAGRGRSRPNGTMINADLPG